MLDEQRSGLQSGASLNISSFDLFINMGGTEAALFSVLYPTGDFTDTGIFDQYLARSGDETSRVVSIGLSWTRKVLSSVMGSSATLAFSCTSLSLRRSNLLHTSGRSNLELPPM